MNPKIHLQVIIRTRYFQKVFQLSYIWSTVYFLKWYIFKSYMYLIGIWYIFRYTYLLQQLKFIIKKLFIRCLLILKFNVKQALPGKNQPMNHLHHHWHLHQLQEFQGNQLLSIVVIKDVNPHILRKGNCYPTAHLLNYMPVKMN